MINEVFNMDCLEGMKMIPDKSIDMILCDLPYGTTACKWDVIIPFAPLWEQYERIIKDNGAIILTASQPFTTILINSNLNLFRYELIWEKTMPTGMALADKRPMKYHENIALFYKKQPVFNKQLKDRSEVGKDRLKKNGKILNGKKVGQHVSKEKLSGTYSVYNIDFVNPSSILKFGSVPNCNGTKLHPTQKPVPLFEYLIRTYTNERQTVLDNCMGSGTTAIACINTGRNYIGFEKEEKYFNIIQERIKKHTVQKYLFD
jgi:site-specific DNA-methyltransferase (adenine-specific)